VNWNEIKRVCSDPGITQGPWRTAEDDWGAELMIGSEVISLTRQDARFIAAARTALPELIEFTLGVFELSAKRSGKVDLIDHALLGLVEELQRNLSGDWK